MKDFLTYLKKHWWTLPLMATIYFFLVQSYVYSEMRFDFEVIYEKRTWIKVIFWTAFMSVWNYFFLVRSSQKKLQK